MKIKKTGTPKIADRGVQCIFVGYALDHASDCYRMYDPTTNRVHVTRDVIWLKRMFYEKPANRPEITLEPRFDVPNHSGQIIGAGEGEPEELHDFEPENFLPDEPETPPGMMTRSGRTVRPPQLYMHEFAEMGLTEAKANYHSLIATAADKMFDPSEIACVGARLGGGFANMQELHVMKYDEAMEQPDKD